MPQGTLLCVGYPMHITLSRAQFPVAEQSLQLMYRQTLLQLMGCVGMT
jgi:hypothetical protein